MSVAHLNRVVRAADKRALELEDKLVAILVPILEEAGRHAARSFQQLATDHMAASADLRRADRLRVAQMGAATAREVLASLSLQAAGPLDGVTSLSTMIAVKPRPEEAAAVADPDGAPADGLHVTLAYLGEYDGDLSTVADALRMVAATHAPLSGVVGGYGEFRPPGCGILLPDVPGLVELRVAVTEALVTAGIGYGRDHGFTPHMTVDGSPEDGEIDVMLERAAGLPLHFDDLLVVRGDVEVIPLPLVGVPALTAAARGKAFCLPAELRGRTDPVRRAAVTAVARDSVEGVGLSFDASNPYIAEALEQTGSQIVEISRTTQADVMKAVTASYDQGFSIPDTAKAIQTALIDSAPARARLIARTELAGAVNSGSLAAARMVEQATGATYYKQWLTAPGAKFPRHEDYDGLDGQTVQLGETFDVGGDQLDHPGDPNGSPEEVCQCRCSIGYTEDASELSASAEPRTPEEPAPVSADVGLAGRLAAAMTAAGGAGWSSPAPEEILPIGCDTAAIKTGEALDAALLDVPGAKVSAVGISPAALDGPVKVAIRDQAAAGQVRTTLDLIGSVHRVPDGLEAVKVLDRDRAGVFVPPPEVGKAGEIAGRFYDDDTLTTFVHEFGHYLDYSLFGDATDFASTLGAEELSGVMQAITDSSAYGELRTLGNKYLLDRRELFARAYEQWITLRTRDSRLLTTLDRYLRLDDGYWSEDDFAPIADELDELFRARGLLV